MSDIFKIQRVRSCLQCGELLSRKCTRCLIHPERKPKIIELYDWPKILETGPCGCIKIACQLLGCKNTYWRYPRLHYKTAKSVARNLYCSKKCSANAANIAKGNRAVKAFCSFCGMAKMVIPAILKVRQHVFCHSEHHYLFVRKKKAEADYAKQVIKNVDNLALLSCEGNCRDVTEHTMQTDCKYRCNMCGHIRHATERIDHQDNRVRLNGTATNGIT